ncbi:MAG: DNA-formamidopyrimidine glycosylase family protein [Polyangiales bacterium]
MPEGDSLHKAARALHAALAGKVVVRLSSSKIRPIGIEGKRVAGCEAVGKHLLIRMEDGRAIRAHFRMTGTFHVYRAGERWRRDPGAARIVIEAASEKGERAEVVAVGFAIPTLEVVRAPEGELPREVQHLGPDLLRPEFDEDEAVRRLRARADLEIGDALLDQTALSGIGNVYKSETLFTLGVTPFVLVRDLSEDTLRAIVGRARRLMHMNMQISGMRTTAAGSNHGSRHNVYGRSKLPCPRCGTIIEMRYQGVNLKRSTYFCSRCQKV